jgi:hypothetical protein
MGDSSQNGATWIFAREADGGFAQAGNKLIDGTLVCTAGLGDNSANGSVWVFVGADGGFE